MCRLHRWGRGNQLTQIGFLNVPFLPNGAFCQDLAQWRTVVRTQVYVVLIFNYLIKIFRLLYNLKLYTFFIEWAIHFYLLLNISYGKLIHMKLLKSVSETIWKHSTSKAHKIFKFITATFRKLINPPMEISQKINVLIVNLFWFRGRSK